MSMPVYISDYEDYLNYTENMRKTKYKTNAFGFDEPQRDWCRKHITHSVHPKYNKCFLCRVEDGDIVKCSVCEEEYHDPKFAQCYKCATPKKGGEK